VRSNQVNLLPESVGMYIEGVLNQVNLLPESVGMYKEGALKSGQSAA
jgi:hypothetical protein